MKNENKLMSQKKYLERSEAAEYLTEKGCRTAKTTLGKFATTGGGPVYQIFGSRALYLPENLDAWADSKMSTPRTSTSQTGGA